MAAPFYILARGVWGFCFLCILCQHLLLSAFVLVGLKYLIVVLVFISLVVVWCWAYFNELIGYCMSLEKCVFRFFAYFKIGLSFLLISRKRFLCIQGTGPLSRYLIYRYFLPFVDCLYFLLNVLWSTTVLIWIKYKLSVFCGLYFDILSKNPLLNEVIKI